MILFWELPDDWRCRTFKYTTKGVKVHSNKPEAEVYYCVTLCFVKEITTYRITEISRLIADVQEVEQVIHYSLPDLKVYKVNSDYYWRYKEHSSMAVSSKGFPSVLEAVLHHTAYTQSLLNKTNILSLAT